MVTLDTIGLMLNDFDAITHLDESCFLTKIINDGDNRVSERDELKEISKIKGLNFVRVDRISGKINLEISGKILKENYHEGININSIENVIYNLNKNSGIKFDTDKIINQAIVMRCDCTDNLQMSNDVSQYIDDMTLYRINTKYKVDNYINKASVIFTNQAKSYKERIIFYDKMYEIMNRDKEMYDILNKAGKINNFKNCLRVESNIVTFRKMRELFKITKCKYIEKTGKYDIKYIQLYDVLNSKEKVNAKIFEKITEKNIPSLFHEYNNSGLGLAQIEKREGRYGIIKNMEYDMKLIKEFIKLNVAGNISRYVKEYQLLMAEMKEKDTRLHPEVQSRMQNNIQEIRTLLSA